VNEILKEYIGDVDLTKKNLYRLVDYYHEDYKILRDYFTIDCIVNEYGELNR